MLWDMRMLQYSTVHCVGCVCHFAIKDGTQRRGRKHLLSDKQETPVLSANLQYHNNTVDNLPWNQDAVLVQSEGNLTVPHLCQIIQILICKNCQIDNW